MMSGNSALAPSAAQSAEMLTHSVATAMAARIAPRKRLDSGPVSNGQVAAAQPAWAMNPTASAAGPSAETARTIWRRRVRTGPIDSRAPAGALQGRGRCACFSMKSPSLG
jgi:hypothetical protein